MLPPSHLKLEPIYKNLFIFKCDSYDILSDKCFKITKKYIHFNVNEENNEIIPLNILDKLIGNKLNASIELFDKTGKILLLIYLEDFIFVKMKNFLDFDYQSIDIMRIKVKYSYSKRIIIKNEKDLINYQRRQKIKKINQI